VKCEVYSLKYVLWVLLLCGDLFRQNTHRPKAIVAMDSFPKLLHMLGLAHDPLKVFAWARDYLIMMMKMKLWTCYVVCLVSCNCV
jgi:hypothetical protein